MRALLLGMLSIAGCAVAETAPAPFAPSDPALPLLQALSDPDPDVRVAAQTDLRLLAASVEPTLRVWTSHPDPEVAGRCRDLLQDLDQARRRPVGRVVTLDARRLYLHLDPLRGRTFLPGERFELLRGKTWVATAEFAQLVGQPGLARMVIVDGDAGGLQEHEITVIAGGLEARRDAQAAPVEASIQLIDDEGVDLEIGFRRRDGVQVGEVCEIRRGGAIVGRVTITRVDECASWVLPVAPTRVEDLRPGDQVLRTTAR